MSSSPTPSKLSKFLHKQRDNQSSSRLAELPTRLSGWFSHTFSSSSTDLSLPSLLSQSTHSSPKSRTSPLLAAARTGKGHLDKAFRYLLDSDSSPANSTDPIWLLGVQHPPHDPPPPPSTPLQTSRRRPSEPRKFSSSSSFRSSTSSSSSASSPPTDSSLLLSQSLPHTPHQNHHHQHWPSQFYSDFTSRIWLTYRSQFQPIRDTSLASLDSDSCSENNFSAASSSSSSSPPITSSPAVLKRWNWGPEKGWSTDQGWGCMLRTGQSLLANALLHFHLGRDWRRPPYPLHTADYAQYVQILTWFLDSPLPLAPFSVHRMALAGKELGKDVGQWFGPSTAAGAIKRLVSGFPEAGLGVAVAADSTIFQSEVYAASQLPDTLPHRHAPLVWGGRAVLILIGIRLGLDGVNPIYYDTIKALYTFPQSVGIAGGRPSSSYYFVGSQADNLFYLDPHHTRPAIPLRPPPSYPEATPESDREKDERGGGVQIRRQQQPRLVLTRTGSSSFSTVSPSPLQKELSTSGSEASEESGSGSSRHHHQHYQAELPGHVPTSMQTVGSPIVSSDGEMSGGGVAEMGGMLQEHYVRAYSAAELKTFHCERVRKMPLSGLDPSMLVGFLCRDEEDWVDLRRRIAELSRTHKTIFSVQDEPPSWPSDSDDNMGFESMSEPEEGEGFLVSSRSSLLLSRSRARSGSSSSSSSVSPPGSVTSSREREGRRSLRKSEEGDVDTEEEPVDPITPGAGRTSFERGGEEVNGEDDDEDDDDGWVDPTTMTRPDGSGRGKGKVTGKGKGRMMDVDDDDVVVEEHFPFPRTTTTTAVGDMDEVVVPVVVGEEGEIERGGGGVRGKRMHMVTARDGGRTRSGGVKGVVVVR